MKMRILLLVSALALSFALTACEFNGGVEQGRCVAFDPAAKTLTVVLDSARGKAPAAYGGAIHTYKLPLESRDMGPAPSIGGRLEIMPEKSVIVIYDPATKSVGEVKVEFVDVEKDIKENHPKVKGKTFPVIDKDKQTVTVYSARLMSLLTFKAAPEVLALPPYAWTPGDEMRIAYRRDAGDQAIRIMNVTKTDIFKR